MLRSYLVKMTLRLSGRGTAIGEQPGHHHWRGRTLEDSERNGERWKEEALVSHMAEHNQGIHWYLDHRVDSLPLKAAAQLVPELAGAQTQQPGMTEEEGDSHLYSHR